MSHDVVVRGGTLVGPNRVYDGDLLVSDGEIRMIVTPGTSVNAETVIDADGLLVMPGVVDPHVHVDDPNNTDDFEHGSKAAAIGGVTTFLTFAWQAWMGEQSNFDAPGTLSEGVDRQKRYGSESVVDFGLHGTISREDEAVFEEIGSLVKDGITSFKLFTAYEFGLSNGFIEQLFKRISDVDAVAVVHTEDERICQRREKRMRASGTGDPEAYPASRPDHAEAMAADDALRLAQAADVKYYGFHTSSRAAADVIDGYRNDGSQIRAETCPHYLTLDDTAYSSQGTLPVIAPPLRKPDDTEAMFESLRAGTLSVVSTDHVGFTREEKLTTQWWDAPYGANSIQYSLPVLHDEAVVKRGLSYPFLVRVLCRNPARTFGLTNKGTLEPGTDADFVLFDPDKTRSVTSADNASKADYSIYEGREVTGSVERTYLRGELIAAGNEVLAEPGYGEFQSRELPDWQP